MPPTVELRTFEDAVAWGDSWMRACILAEWELSQVALDLKTERSIAETEPVIVDYANLEADMARIEGAAWLQKHWEA